MEAKSLLSCLPFQVYQFPLKSCSKRQENPSIKPTTCNLPCQLLNNMPKKWFHMWIYLYNTAVPISHCKVIVHFNTFQVLYQTSLEISTATGLNSSVYKALKIIILVITLYFFYFFISFFLRTLFRMKEIQRWTPKASTVEFLY